MKHPGELPADIKSSVRRALSEDIGSGDLTAELLPATRQVLASVSCREQAVLCGAPWFNEVYRQVDDSIQISWNLEDGDDVEPGQIVCTLRGPARSVLTGERTALNFLQLLSGTATTTKHYLSLLGHTRTRLLDTRKTLPGLRTAQKYAVACAGGKNHRMGLYDAILIKENHISAAGSISAAVKRAKSMHRNVEVEVETLEQLQEALDAGVNQIMLDNFEPVDMRKAVELNAGKAILEVSGGVTRETIADIAATGVDYVSVGALTKHVRAIDYSMRIIASDKD